MNIFEVGKKENIVKEYNVYRQGICIGKWAIRRVATSNEFEFYNKKDERMSDIYYTSQMLEMEFEEIIDWSKANFYLNPVARIVYISDMHEREPFAGYCVVPFDINKSLAEMKAIGKNFRADFPQEAIPAKNKITIEVSLKQEGDRYVVSIK